MLPLNPFPFATRISSVLRVPRSGVVQSTLLHHQKFISPLCIQGSRRSFTRTRQLSTKPKPNSTQPPSNPSFGNASFADLGANRTVKIVVIVALSVFGTMETVFWVKVLWAKFVGSGEEGDAGKE